MSLCSNVSVMTHNDEDSAIKLSATDVKNKKQLMEEVQVFATMLHQAVGRLEGTSNRREQDKITLTFLRDDAQSLALTLHQLLWIFKGTEEN
jgi:hypothetical protein